MIKRICKYSKSKSFFLFGPRGVGKSTFLKMNFLSDDIIWIDLLDHVIESRLRRSPQDLKNLILKNTKTVIIDEVQKNPELLNIVHQMTNENQVQFILTGSSARKLKRGQANLLAGRAFSYKCFPFVHSELNELFVLEDILRFGSLPRVFNLDQEEKKDYLRAYIDIYFKEEIVAEQLIRNLLPFRNFLEVAAQSNGKIVNINLIAKDVGVDHKTVQNYFQILEDTMVGFFLPHYDRSIRNRQAVKSKFYYFDLGVQRVLSGRIDLPVSDNSYEFGDAFEHFIILEIYRLVRYKKPDWKLSYFRSADDAEIDLIIERPGQKSVIVEIKSTKDTNKLDAQKMRGFFDLIRDFPEAEVYLVSRDPIVSEKNNVQFYPWRPFFIKIGLVASSL